MRSSILVLLACAVLPPGCFTYPCDRDVLACEEGAPLAIDRACQVSDALVLELGEGEGTFAPLADETWPQVHHGAQGGIHFMLGLRLENVDVDHEDFEVELEARDCTDDCTTMQMLSTRTFVVDASYFEEDGDALVLADVVLLLDREPHERGEITVRVTDSCGRMAESVHAM
jgi:hypothetical protein